MHPVTDMVTGGVPDGMTARVLAKPGSAYLVYLRPNPRRSDGATAMAFAKEQVVLNAVLPAGEFNAEWYNPREGAAIGVEHLWAGEGPRKLTAPAFADDVVLVIRRTGARPPAGPWEGIRPIPRTLVQPQESVPAPERPAVVEVTTNLYYRSTAPVAPGRPARPPSAGASPTSSGPASAVEPPAAEAPRRTWAAPPHEVVVVTNGAGWLPARKPGSGTGSVARPPKLEAASAAPRPSRAPATDTDVIISTNRVIRAPAPSTPPR